MRIALSLFILIPILEMYILIQVGSQIGAIPTIALVVLTATLGVWLLRLEGLATLERVQEKLNAGQIPGTELLEGIMLLVGGALLLTPGFATDAIGFCCLIPFLRRPIALWLMNRGVLGAMQFGSRGFQTGSFNQQGDIIDGDFEVANNEGKNHGVTNGETATSIDNNIENSIENNISDNGDNNTDKDTDSGVDKNRPAN